MADTADKSPGDGDQRVPGQRWFGLCFGGGSEMIYSFDSEIANKYGVDGAVILNNIAHWLKKNLANDKNIFDGRPWTYNSVKAWGRLYTFWSENQIRRTLEKLEEAGAIESGNFNTNQYDRTKWFTLSIPLFSQLVLANLPNGFGENARPIPDIKPVIKHSKKKTPTPFEIPEGMNTEVRKLFDEFLMMRTAIKKPVKTQIGINGLIKRLSEIAGDSVEKQIETIQRSIDREWLSFFADKDQQPKQYGPVPGSIDSGMYRDL